MKTIFITREIPEEGLKILKEKGYDVTVGKRVDPLTERELIKEIKNKNYDAIITLLTDKIGAKVFDASPLTKLFANYASGYDNIDVGEAARRGITVTNAPGDLTSEAVAEHAIALMLALAARIVEADESVRRGKYKGWSPMNFIGMDLLGKTLGLVGAGRIGERMAFYSKGLGMKIIYTDLVRNERIEKEQGATYHKELEEVLKEADVVSLHVPLVFSTRHLINEERLHLMKPSAFLINTSRGPVVDEKALTKILKNKIIAGAALDVFEFEPKTVPGLVKLQNVILTPHIASASIEARTQMAKTTAQNVVDFLEGRTPANKVTK